MEGTFCILCNYIQFARTASTRRAAPHVLTAVSEGDLMWRLHEQHPLGRVVDVHIEPARIFLDGRDGTALLTSFEGRYDLYITIAVTGTINHNGFFINNTLPAAPGNEFHLASNRLSLHSSVVWYVSETRP